jgi:UDP-GlcNAc:undecaprenyl-phosphate GlcNAc-1-phosphate transferase
MDLPNSRSLHTTPVPRTGGVSLMLGMLTSWALLPVVLTIQVWFAVCVLVAVSLADDIFTLPVWQKMLTHVIVAAWLSATLLFPTHGWVLIIIVAFAIAWMTNLYNFGSSSY